MIISQEKKCFKEHNAEKDSEIVFLGMVEEKNCIQVDIYLFWD